MMKIGIICPSEIAYRRFMPAVKQFTEIEFIGIGVCSVEERFGKNYIEDEKTAEILLAERAKAELFIQEYGGKIFNSYEEIVYSNEIDALYIPLPPALHFIWAKMALEAGKNVLVEKPSTISAENTRELTEIAAKKGLALHENYMFAFHEQLDAIDDVIRSGELGEMRLYRVSFGFPMRAANDFRYNKKLGGGALIDAGGYTIKYATRLLGDTAKIAYAQLNYIDGYEVDMYGSGALVNDQGVTVQIAFGMDNNYKCELEAWGSKGCLMTGRVLTAPVGFVPTMTIRKGNTDEIRELPSDDSFKKSIQHFLKCIGNSDIRENNYREMQSQADMVEQFSKMASR